MGEFRDAKRMLLSIRFVAVVRASADKLAVPGLVVREDGNPDMSSGNFSAFLVYLRNSRSSVGSCLFIFTNRHPDANDMDGWDVADFFSIPVSIGVANLIRCVRIFSDGIGGCDCMYWTRCCIR